MADQDNRADMDNIASLGIPMITPVDTIEVPPPPSDNANIETAGSPSTEAALVIKEYPGGFRHIQPAGRYLTFAHQNPNPNDVYGINSSRRIGEGYCYFADYLLFEMTAYNHDADEDVVIGSIIVFADDKPILFKDYTWNVPGSTIPGNQYFEARYPIGLIVKQGAVISLVGHINCVKYRQTMILNLFGHLMKQPQTIGANSNGRVPAANAATITAARAAYRGW